MYYRIRRKHEKPKRKDYLCHYGVSVKNGAPGVGTGNWRRGGGSGTSQKFEDLYLLKLPEETEKKIFAQGFKKSKYINQYVKDTTVRASNGKEIPITIRNTADDYVRADIDKFFADADKNRQKVYDSMIEDIRKSSKSGKIVVGFGKKKDIFGRRVYDKIDTEELIDKINKTPFGKTFTTQETWGPYKHKYEIELGVDGDGGPAISAKIKDETGRDGFRLVLYDYAGEINNSNGRPKIFVT